MAGIDGNDPNQMTMAQALNLGLRRALERDSKTVLFGEDIGRLGGVFRVTDGLQKDFGEHRVIDAPLAESGIVGAAVGLAMRGYRPVLEMQFDGFVYPAFDQIVSQVAKLRRRTEGAVGMPITIRIPYGGGIGGGVRGHPVGVGLDECRSVTGASTLEGVSGDGHDCKDVIAVDPDPGKAEPSGTLEERCAGLAIRRLRDRPLVVLAQEHDRSIKDRGEHEGLIDVALRGRPVTEIPDGGVLGSVKLDAHRVADGVEHLIADDDGARCTPVTIRVPSAVRHSTEHGEHVEGRDTADPGNAVLAIGGERIVGRTHRARRTDLRSLLAQARSP